MAKRNKSATKLTLQEQLVQLEEKKRLTVAEESILLRKAMESDSPDALLKAQQIIAGVQNRAKGESKSYFVDPHQVWDRGGYAATPGRLTDQTLRNMARAPIIKAIIETRIEQVAAFAQPPEDKYSTGFKIRKKKSVIEDEAEEVLSSQDKFNIKMLTKSIINCGNDENKWHGDTFDTWIRKGVKDSLTLDRLTSEIVRNGRGTPSEFFATDAATFRIAATLDDDDAAAANITRINGYLPSYVQLYNSEIVAEYYPWELMWGIRNPSSSIYANGYGESELETLISTVTAMLEGDAYNANIFRVGAVPNGLFKVSGNINETRLRELKQSWTHQMAGYANAHKTGFIEADKLDYVDLSRSNRDMEYSKYQEYLIRLACAIYKIAPSEIGFQIEGSSEGGSLFETNNESRLKYSKDKGLKPLLKFIEKLINKYWITPIHPEYEFVFVGLEAETEEKELEMDLKKAGSFKSLKEIRAARGLSETIDEDDVILNPVYIQWKQMQQAAAFDGGSESNEFVDNEFGDAEEDDNILMNDAISFLQSEIAQ